MVSSCVPYSKLKYFNDIDKLDEPVVNPVKQKKISVYDRLYIRVLSTDQQTADLLNASANNMTTTLPGYVVDESGCIIFPFVGDIKVGGLTLSEAREAIKKSISSIITNPEVMVSYENNTITVLGEVNNQGSYPFTQDYITIYQSLAMAGGFTQYSNRKNVVLIRKESNKLVYYKLNLSNSKITSSPLYYIMPDDIIIVEPLRQKSWSVQTTIVPTITSVISLVVSVVTISTLANR